MPPESHARLSPSAAFRCLNCTPSLVMSELFPDETSIYAEEGTLAHEICEKKLKLELAQYATADEAEGLQYQLEKLISSELYDSDMGDYTDEYVNEIAQIIRENPRADIVIEQAVRLDDAIPGCYGTADCLILMPGKLFVIDFKYGKHVPVSADHNYQLQLYALGALDMYDFLYDLSDVELRIIQPRAEGSNGWATTRTDLYTWRDTFVKERASKALEGSGECVVGDWCMFCRAKPVCRAYASQFDVPDDYLGTPAMLSRAEIAERLGRLDGVKAYLDKLKAYALRQCLTGDGIPGYKAVEGRGSRVWTDMPAAFKKANEAGFSDDLLYERIPVSLSGVEKMMGKKLFAEELGCYVYKTKGKPTLAVSSDRRKEYTNETAAADFEGITV